MGLVSRITYVLKSWLNWFVNRSSDPAKELDYSYEQLRDELQDVKRGVADLTTQRKRLEKQRDRLQANVEKHNDQARAAVNQDREDLAKRALQKKQANMEQLEQLDSQITELERTQEMLIEKKNELATEVSAFRTKKETMKARHAAAEASVEATEAVTGLSETGVAEAIEQIEQETEEMEARAAALEELEASGELDNVLEEGDSIDQELDRVTSDDQINAELETLRNEMSEVDEEVADLEVEASET